MMLPSMRPLVRWNSLGTIKLVADGNSITSGGQDGLQSIGGVPGYVSRNVYPFNAQAYANVAIGGQNTDQMIANAADVDGAYTASKICVLFAQDGTNQNSTGDTAAVNCQKMLNYLAARKAANPWNSIVVATAPPVYRGDHLSQASTDTYNARLDEYNDLLRLRWREEADMLFETRQPGSPYDQARYPNYLKSTFFDTTVINGISNDLAWITEPSGGPVPNQKIHYTAAGIAALAPFLAAALRRCPVRRPP